MKKGKQRVLRCHPPDTNKVSAQTSATRQLSLATLSRFSQFHEAFLVSDRAEVPVKLRIVGQSSTSTRQDGGRDLLVGVRRSFLLFIPFLFIILVRHVGLASHKKIEFLFSFIRLRSPLDEHQKSLLSQRSSLHLRAFSSYSFRSRKSRALQEKIEKFSSSSTDTRLRYVPVCAYLPNPPCS